MANLDKFTEDELQRELDARKARRHEDHLEKFLARIEPLKNAITGLAGRGLVDALTPDHSCTSCSDGNPCNGYLDNETVRCARCFLLGVQRSQSWDLDVEPVFLLFERNEEDEQP